MIKVEHGTITMEGSRMMLMSELQSLVYSIAKDEPTMYTAVMISLADEVQDSMDKADIDILAVLSHLMEAHKKLLK